MAVASLSQIPGLVHLDIPIGTGGSDPNLSLGVFKGTAYDPSCTKGVYYGYWKNTTGSSVTLHAAMTFAFGGYTCGVWCLVSASSPDTITATPAANATAAGATQLNITSGLAASSGTVVVPNGQWVYIVQIDAGFSWAGGSTETLELQNASNVAVAVVNYFPSPGSGNFTNGSWKSPFFLTGGSVDVPSATLWGSNGVFAVPNGHYVYVAQLSFDITWAGASDQGLWLRENVTDQVELAYFPTQSTGHFAESWLSPFFLTGGSSTRPSTKWDLSNGSPINIFPAQSGSTGFWHNTSGSEKYVFMRPSFGFAGYGPYDGYFVVSASDPATIAAPSSISLPNQGIWIG